MEGRGIVGASMHLRVRRMIPAVTSICWELFRDLGECSDLVRDIVDAQTASFTDAGAALLSSGSG
jgi:hypothetical protein